MRDRTTSDAHGIARVGTTIESLGPVPDVGTWEVAAHWRCEGTGRLMALTPGEPAPLCPVCRQQVRWRLLDLAPALAGDHPHGDPGA
jgi:hypothetical protein